jgi:protease-4
MKTRGSLQEKKRRTTDVIKAIEDKTDDDIKGISILNNQSTLGMAQSKALRDELLSFKNQGNL